MKITRRQLRKIIHEALDPCGYSQVAATGIGYGPSDTIDRDDDDYYLGWEDGAYGVPSQDLSIEYGDGYRAGRKGRTTPQDDALSEGPDDYDYGQFSPAGLGYTTEDEDALDDADREYWDSVLGPADKPKRPYIGSIDDVDMRPRNRRSELSPDLKDWLRRKKEL